MDVMRLLRSDFGASYVWNPRKSRFDEAVSFNMERSNLRRYEDWYQFRDPMTFELRTRRRATLVDDVIPREVLMRTEFYNDFLARDGLHHGVNMFIFDGDRDLGDFRIWRAQGRPDFCDRDLDLLDALEPHLRRALLRCGGCAGLTPRESDVAALVARLHRPRYRPHPQHRLRHGANAHYQRHEQDRLLQPRGARGRRRAALVSARKPSPQGEGSSELLRRVC
jgi:hypothetical protein